jgi:transposase-like protein
MTTTAAPHAPPCCPNPACYFHSHQGLWRYRRTGCFARARPPLSVQRYQCCHCRRHFSDQTFRTSYWLKRPDLLVPVFHRLLGCSGFRQIAREFGCSPQTIATLAARLGRHCLLFHLHHRPHGPLTEHQTLDGFVTFEYSQFHPTVVHVIAGQHSHFFHGFTLTELRRSGRMTDAQRARRAQLEARWGRPSPGASVRDLTALLRLVTATTPTLVLHSDQHPDYPRALRRLRGCRLTHRTVSSRAARTPLNPLFPINLLDLLIRHCGANHKRETIAFSKRRQSVAERLWILLVWRNYMKSFSERKRDGSPAMRLQLLEHKVTPEALLRERRFVTRTAVPEPWQAHYWRDIPTRAFPRCHTHRLTYAA